MRRLCACLVALLPVVALSTAEAGLLCKTRSGKLFVREACKRRDVPVDLAASGPLGARGTEGATGATGAAGFGVEMKDANGALVGVILDEPAIFPVPGTRVVRTVDGQVVSLGVDPATGFPDTAIPFVAYFEQPGCTGRAFLAPLLPGTFMISPAFVHDDLAFYPVDAPTLHNAISILTFTTPGSCSGTFTAPDQCCTPASVSTFLVEARVFALGTLGLVPPFHTAAP
jgi:hypothetical protein